MKKTKSTPLPSQWRGWGLLGLFAVCAAGIFLLLPRLPQDVSYHHFSDARHMLGIPYALDVLSNIPFLVLGTLGLLRLQRHHGADRLETMFSGAFMLGVLLTGIGSMYYHWEPSNHTLMWDRLPMAIAFMAITSLILAERVSPLAGVSLFPALIICGIGSVLYWNLTESIGVGDLRPYLLVQFFPLLLVLYVCLFYRAGHASVSPLLWATGWYAVAKICEAADSVVYHGTLELISGHTLKHLAAAVAVWWLMQYTRTTRIR